MASSTDSRSAGIGTVELPERRTYRGPFAVMTILFFVWGFMSVWNDILIPRFKDAFHLDYFQAMLVALAFCGAYFAGSLAYYLISMFAGDPINHIGYKNGVIIGLLIAAAGSFLFYPAAILLSYPFFLVALFIVGLGFAMLQIAANPYITILGPERTASSRLNLSQAFNSLGTTIGPIIAGYLIFKVFNGPGSHGAQSVKIPYLCFGGVFLVLAVCFAFADLPNFINVEHIPHGAGALKYPHTVLGMVAIFMYVGGEVCVGSSIINFMNLPALGRLSHQAASVLMMAVLGGALMPPLQGIVADRFGIQFSFIVPMFSYAFITFYGVYGYRAGRRKESVTVNPAIIRAS